MKRMQLLLGVLIGVVITLVLLFGHRTIINPYYTMAIPKWADTTVPRKLPTDEIMAIKSSQGSLEEKLSSLNKRFDDFLVFGGIIITLLLAINVGVYVKAEGEVEKHFSENFEEYRQRVIAAEAEVQQMVSQASTELELIATLRRRSAPSQITPP